MKLSGSFSNEFYKIFSNNNTIYICSSKAKNEELFLNSIYECTNLVPKLTKQERKIANAKVLNKTLANQI